MRELASLEAQLRGLDAKDYGAYQSLKGSYEGDGFLFHILRIPKDPYAPPGTGIYHLSVSREDAGFPEDYFKNRVRKIALRDFLARRFFEASQKISPVRRGTGHSGIITLAEPGQEILERTSVQLYDDRIEVRFFMGLPAKGRKINAKTATKMLLEELPQIVEASLYAGNLDQEALRSHIETSEDADFLRKQLRAQNLVAFVADASVLPRKSGIDPRPLLDPKVVKFKSPESLRCEFELPNKGKITGMGVPTGITLIVGGGYHGKSTLLEALEAGIWQHLPGDGRELCVALNTAMKIRAQSGRSVTKTDISAFINHLPMGQDTKAFSTSNASGSTSQAAFISESVELGAQLLLMDEDSCAANFMVRDARMQQLVLKEKEPITTFVDRVKQLHDDLGISTILVMGGSGDYFDEADCVIQMEAFVARDVSEEARTIAKNSPTGRKSEGQTDFSLPQEHRPNGKRLNPKNDFGHFRIKPRDLRYLQFGSDEIDLSDLEQLKENAQIQAIGQALDKCRYEMDSEKTLREIIDTLIKEIESPDSDGLELLDPDKRGHLASFRALDLAAVWHRLR